MSVSAQSVSPELSKVSPPGGQCHRPIPCLGGATGCHANRHVVGRRRERQHYMQISECNFLRIGHPRYTSHLLDCRRSPLTHGCRIPGVVGTCHILVKCKLHNARRIGIYQDLIVTNIHRGHWLGPAGIDCRNESICCIRRQHTARHVYDDVALGDTITCVKLVRIVTNDNRLAIGHIARDTQTPMACNPGNCTRLFT